jgi:hypothetical protein
MQEIVSTSAPFQAEETLASLNQYSTRALVQKVKIK